MSVQCIQNWATNEQTDLYPIHSDDATLVFIYPSSLQIIFKD